MTQKINQQWAVYGERLRWLERAYGKTAREIAGELKIHDRNWSNYKVGVRELPTAVAGELRRLYGVSLDWLYLGEEHRHSTTSGRGCERHDSAAGKPASRLPSAAQPS